MVSDRATSTTPFAAMSVLERASELDDVVHLELGEPDFQPPREAVEAAVAAIRHGHSSYTNSRGKPALREAIAAYYDRRYGVDIDVNRIVVTPGTSPALLLVYLALLDPGDEAVLTDPYYACYPNFVRQAGGRITTVSLDPSAGFAPDVGAFERAVGPGTQAVMLNSPANPTGAVLSDGVLSELIDVSLRAGATVVSDEVYHGLSYDEQAHSVLEYTEEAFAIDGFSKRFAMTGWRLGWIVCPPAYAETVNRLAQNLLICAPNFVQDAGTAAIEVAEEVVPEMRETYRERRDLLVSEVDRLGIGAGYVPGGAYYLLADVSDFGDATTIADLLLEEAGVATTPGADFGEVAAPYLRLSYATGTDDLREAARRIEGLLERYGETAQATGD